MLLAFFDVSAYESGPIPNVAQLPAGRDDHHIPSLDAHTSNWDAYGALLAIARLPRSRDRMHDHAASNLAVEIVEVVERDAKQPLEEDCFRTTASVVHSQRIRRQLPAHTNRLGTPR
jgi:hypothetical protein